MNRASDSDDPAIPLPWLWHRFALLRIREALLGGQGADAGRKSFREPGNSVNATEVRIARDLLLAEYDGRKNALTEVDAALGRIARGCYGICEVTGKPIAATRLRVLPWTRYSFEVATRRERARYAPDNL